MSLARFDARYAAGPSDEMVAALERDGACILLDALPAGLCDRLLHDFDGHLEKLAWGVDDLGYRNEFYGSRTKRLHGLFSKSPSMVEVLMLPVFLGLARRVIVAKETASDIRLSNAELMVLNQGQTVQAFHTDGASWSRAQALEPNETLVSANVALTDFTAENGATRVVPGSHRWKHGREPVAEEICQAVMPKGAALIYAGRVLHSGGANATPERRVGLYLGYVASWLRPIENQLLTNDPADVLALPEDAQRLLDVVPGGFTVFA